MIFREEILVFLVDRTRKNSIIFSVPLWNISSELLLNDSVSRRTRSLGRYFSIAVIEGTVGYNPVLVLPEFPLHYSQISFFLQ